MFLCKNCLQNLLEGQLIRDPHSKIHLKVRKYKDSTQFFLTKVSFLWRDLRNFSQHKCIVLLDL